MEKLEVTWWRATKIWWSLLWRGIFYALIIGIPLGIIIGFLAATLGVAKEIRPYAQVVGFIAGIPIGIWVVKIVLEKHYSDFRIVLLPSLESVLNNKPADKNLTERND